MNLNLYLWISVLAIAASFALFSFLEKISNDGI